MRILMGMVCLSFFLFWFAGGGAFSARLYKNWASSSRSLAGAKLARPFSQLIFWFLSS